MSLAIILRSIDMFDPSRTGLHTEDSYEGRNTLVCAALMAAISEGIPSGIGYDPNCWDFPIVVYIDLPTGQVSWHLPAYPKPFDGHDGKEKTRRIDLFYRQTITGLLEADTQTGYREFRDDVG